MSHLKTLNLSIKYFSNLHKLFFWFFFKGLRFSISGNTSNANQEKEKVNEYRKNKCNGWNGKKIHKIICYLSFQSNRNINWDYLRKYNGNPANQNTKGDNKKREDLYLIFSMVYAFYKTILKTDMIRDDKKLESIIITGQNIINISKLHFERL